MENQNNAVKKEYSFFLSNLSRKEILFFTNVNGKRISEKLPLDFQVKSIFENLWFVLFNAICISILIVPNVIFQIFLREKKSNNSIFSDLAIDGVISTFCFLSFASAWMLFFYLLYRRKFVQVHSETEIYGFPNPKTNTLSSLLESTLVLSSTLFFVMLLIIRSGAPQCQSHILTIVSDFNWNPYLEVPIFPMDTAFWVVLVSNISAIVMKERRIFLTLFSWVLSLVGMIIGAILTKSSSAVLIIVFYTILSCLIFMDNFYLRAQLNELYDQLKERIEENEILADQQKVNQMKDVIGNVSHDLKTPLSSFMQGIDFMLDTLTEFEQKLPPDTLKHDSFHQFFSEMKMHMKNIKNTNAFMLLTINRCIDFTKASKGLKLIPHLDTIDLLETLSLPLNCMKNIQDRIKISLLPIDNQIYNYIVTDKQWLQENVLCLLSNAVKYSTGGEVTVHASLQRQETPESTTTSSSIFGKIGEDFPSFRGGGLLGERFSQHLLIEIEDAGIGMAAEKIMSLFSPFSQAQKLAGGTGLGLYSLSKRIEALGGKFGVRGRRDGKTGSLFWFTIPYRPDYAMTSHHMNSSRKSFIRLTSSIDDQGFETIVHQRLENQRRNSLYEDHPSRLPRRLSMVTAVKRVEVHPTETPHSNPGEEGSLSSPLRILLVEDSPTIAKMTSMLLKKMGFHVSTAENGHIGLNMMMSADDEKKKYDLVLMDFQMPVMDGLEATRRYREYEKESQDKVHPVNHRHPHPHPHQLIIGLSATCDKDIVEDAMKMGLDDYLMKPVSQDAILKIIKQYHLSYNSTV